MLKVYNTLTKQKETFEPLEPPFVGMYVCGPTVYDDPHLGHAKSYVSFDVIVRFLRKEGYVVRYVQNITDVGHLLGDDEHGEDRVQKRARLEKLEPVEIAQKYENHFFRDMDRLNCIRPDISCRATGHIPEMIELVDRLLDGGFAYEVEGDVYFDVSKFEDYGKLSGRRIDELMEGARVGVAEGKRNSIDFALWKKADSAHLMQWPSPWGRGYPGWHLECSVMSMKYLGDSIDIHGGGLDNQFPHHECEIAQSEAATGKPFVKYWLHNNMVTVDDQKMSKSLGNFVTLEDLFDKYDPMTVRFFILQGHYRSPQDFSDQALEAANKGLNRMVDTVAAVREAAGKVRISPDDVKGEWRELRDRFWAFMEDDFKTSGAITVLYDAVKRANAILAEDGPVEEFGMADTVFSLLGEEVLGLDFRPAMAEEAGRETEVSLVDFLVELRNRFRKQKAWDLADEIRTRLSELRIILEDDEKGTHWKKKK